ncbi:MAG: hypothetical protein Q4B29_01470 [Candidatus Saccharibacteria bacterium]|nr:hypothetical protein [Candidatus Saccharibacteria bacterium]
MAYAKNKNPRYSKPKKRSREPDSFIIAKNTILTTIILSIIIVILAFFFSFLLNPERIAKQDLEKISRNYYETYLYEVISKGESPGEIMKKYEESGLPKVTLRELLLLDDRISPELQTYCDKNETYVKFFPEKPYGKNNYHVEYNYSCTF